MCDLKAKTIQLGVLLCCLLAATSVVASPDCPHIINPDHSTFTKILKASLHYDDASLLPSAAYAEVAMKKLDLVTEAEREIFTKAMKLKPLLDSEILHEAISSEASMRGFKGKASVERLFNIFNALPTDQKESLIDGVIQNILFIFGEKIDFSNIDQISNLASSYKMTKADVFSVIKSFENMPATHFEEAKLVILDFFRNPSPALLQRVVTLQKFLNPNYPLLGRPQFRLEAGRDDRLQDFSKYLGASNTRIKIYFLDQNWDQLSTDQLMMVEKDKAWPLFPLNIRESINGKLYLKNSLAIKAPETPPSMSAKSKECRVVAKLFHQANSTADAEKYLRQAFELLDTPADFVNLFSNSYSNLDVYWVRNKLMPVYLQHFYYLKPKLDEVLAVLKIFTSGNQSDETFIDLQKKICADADQHRIMRTPVDYIQVLMSVSPRVLDDCSLKLIDGFMHLSPTSSEVRQVINQVPFHIYSPARGAFLERGALRAKTVEEYLHIFDEFPSQSLPFDTFRVKALKSSLFRFLALNPSSIDVEELQVRANFGNSINRYILVQYLKSKGAE